MVSHNLGIIPFRLSSVSDPIIVYDLPDPATNGERGGELKYDISLSLLLFTCLSVSKDTGIISTECILQHIGTELVKHKLLTTKLWIVGIH